jgi:hypothetical protein
VNFHNHPSNNMLLTVPPGMTDCSNLPATMCVEDGVFKWVASFWKPSPEEMQLLIDGGSVALFVFSQTHPPVAIGVEPKT